MEHKEMLDACVAALAQTFDEQAGLLSTFIEDGSHGYHTDRSGVVHPVHPSGLFAAAVLCEGYEEYYSQALRIVELICALQDTREESPTFGLWQYNMEDDLEHMLAPDYNFADFVGKSLHEIVLCSKCPIPQTLMEKLLAAIRNAAICSIRRNVGLDYSNIGVMSSLTITCAGQILEDPEIFALGRERLERFCEYTRFNGAFSEYNSSCYCLIMMDDISRMLQLLKDPRCLELAQELNYYVWEQLASHYNCCLGQLTPPQARAYINLENGLIAWRIWRGTNGLYGKCLPEAQFQPDTTTLEALRCPLQCPKELLPLFAETERFLTHTYYKKNDLRKPGEDVTIIRELDSPDLTAYSFQTERLSMGAFAFCDTWRQRRNCMVIWNQEHPKYFRLRSINGDFDFCGGVTTACQDKNRILGQLGLVTDRGSSHYILDKVKNGIYETDALYFLFELGGECGDLRIEQQGKDFFIRDGEVTVTLHIASWVYDGKEAPVYVAEDGKSVILEGYLGERTVLDTNALGPTYGVFTLTAEDAAHKAEAAMLSSSLYDGKVESSWGGMHVVSCDSPVPYRVALGLDQ